MRVVVIGAGAGGVEVAFAAAGSLDRAGHEREVTMVDRCEGAASGIRPAVPAPDERALARPPDRLPAGRGRGGHRAGPGAPGRRPSLPSDLAIWLTGPRERRSWPDPGLPTDPRGFLWTDDRLRSTADSRVFAVGDCGTMAGHPDPARKSGVYAVREAPILWYNLLATVRAGPLAATGRSAASFRSSTPADGRAMLSYQGLVSWSAWAWRLKDRIDRSFIRRYQRLTEGLKPY